MPADLTCLPRSLALLARPAFQLCLHAVEVGVLEKVDNLLLAVDVELLEHVVAVRVHRAGGDGELLLDARGVAACCYEAKHVDLATRETVVLADDGALALEGHLLRCLAGRGLRALPMCTLRGDPRGRLRPFARQRPFAYGLYGPSRHLAQVLPKDGRCRRW